MTWQANMHSDNELTSLLGKSTDKFFNIIDSVNINKISFDDIKRDDVIAIAITVKGNGKHIPSWIRLHDLILTITEMDEIISEVNKRQSEKMFSEEDMRNSFCNGYRANVKSSLNDSFQDWLNKFKK